MRRWVIAFFLAVACGFLWHHGDHAPTVLADQAAAPLPAPEPIGAPSPGRPEAEEPDPYKIHREYENEPWRLPSSYRVLALHFLVLLLLNGAMFAANRLRGRARA